MKMLRRWQLDATRPFAAELAADARLSATDYADDQVWRLMLGAHEAPALALQTRFGGRAGIARLVPMWVLDRGPVYQAQGYATPPVLTAFAPGYLQAEGRITPELALRAEFWAMESHAVGARFTIANTGASPIPLRLDLFGQVIVGGREHRVRAVALPNGGAGLYLGHIGNLHPLVLLEGGKLDAQTPDRPMLSAELRIPAGGRASLRIVHAGMTSRESSLALARRWLKQNWNDAFSRIAEAAAAIPDIETGDADLDATITFSYRQLAQSWLRPTGSLPHASFVAVRAPDRGFSPRGDGSDHIRAWSGQNPTHAYLTALATAAIDPALAQGVVLNYLATQQPDGWIDWKPGLGGQRQGQLCLPLLARLAWGIFQYTEDDAFLRVALPGLERFFERWLAPDLDADGDGLPEWQAETQTGYPYFPTFAVAQPWGQHADIRAVEAPDMAAYLLSEAASLREMAWYLRDAERQQIMTSHIERLSALLESLWADGRYGYRDRDTHLRAPGMTIIEDAGGAEEQFPALALTPPRRMIVRVSGGLEHVPKAVVHLQGIDAAGNPLTETAMLERFVWTHTRGVYTTQAVFSQLDRVWCDNLVNVYRLHVETLDTSRLDINALLPLWSPGLPSERAEAVTVLLSDPAQFLRANGVTMCSAQDATFNPSNASGSGGIWPYWFTLVGEGLIETGAGQLAAEMLKRLLKAQTAVLAATKEFSEFYHSDEPRGLGEGGHLAGIAPLHLLLRVLGVRVISPGKVWTGGPFVWGSPVTLTHKGVRVTRSEQGTEITFLSGHTVALPPDAEWQAVTDLTHTPAAPDTSQANPFDG